MATQEMLRETELAEPGVSIDTVVKARMDFAEQVFGNVQGLNRLMDQKASFLLGTVTVLTAALGIVASRALGEETSADWEQAILLLGSFTLILYLVTAFLVVYNATRVFKASPGERNRATTAPSLIFPLMLLQWCRIGSETDELTYLNRLANVSINEMLHDYANQIIEISKIYERKQRQVNRSTDLFQWLTIFWIATALLLLTTVIL